MQLDGDVVVRMLTQRAAGMAFEGRKSLLLEALATFSIPQRLDQARGPCRIPGMHQQIHVRHRTLPAGVKAERMERHAFERHDPQAGLARTSIDSQQQFLDSSVTLSHVNSLLLEKMHPLL